MPKFLIIVEDLVKKEEVDGYGCGPARLERKPVNARRLRRILNLADVQGFKLHNPLVIRVDDEQKSGFQMRKDKRSQELRDE